MKRTIIIEGNIGAGKSTLLRRLADTQFSSFKHVVVQEPVDEWESLRDASGHSILQQFYSNMPQNAFTFQAFILLTRVERMQRAVAENPDAVVFCERSHMTDRNIFVKGLVDTGVMTEMQTKVFDRMYNTLTAQSSALKVDGIIYMRTSPETCMQRISSRGRGGEDSISPKYLGGLHAAHEDWLTASANVLTVDGEQDLTQEAFWNAALRNIEAFAAAPAAAGQQAGEQDFMWDQALPLTK